MGYRKAEEILPLELIELIQKYVDGESIYIPRRPDNRKEWGSDTPIKQELKERNYEIYKDYDCGMSVAELAGKFYLSEKSIQRIIREKKREVIMELKMSSEPVH